MRGDEKMKPKWIFTVLAGLMICLIFSTSQGADKFYYGGFHVQALYPKCPELRDSLRFNIIFAQGLNQDNIQYPANAGLQAIAEQADANSPTYWSCVSRYTMWEAEGFPGSYVNLQYHGGTLVNDPYASGGKAMSFSGSDTGLIQWGPTYYQEPTFWDSTIFYTAVFRLKYLLYSPRGPMAPGPPTPLCRLMVLDTIHNTVLRDRLIYKSDFTTAGVYDTFQLANYTVPNGDSIDFRIYRFNRPEPLYVDYVKVYNEDGKNLMDGSWDSVIIAYVDSPWVHTPIPDGDTAVYRWYMKDQPQSIDCYMPYAYIDTLLKSNPPKIPGAQFSGNNRDSSYIHEYLLRTNPVEYMIDPYPFGFGSTGSNFQVCIDSLTKWLDYNKRKALSLNKDLWVAIQAFAMCNRRDTSCQGYPDSIEYPVDSGIFYCWRLRDPTPYEVRVQTFLAMCYGADAVMNYRTSYHCGDSTFLETGLYDQCGDSVTRKWEEIKNFTGPRVEQLGPIIKDLTWLGACSDDSVGSFTLRDARQSYIYNIVPQNHFPPLYRSESVRRHLFF
jgi:hypothetical protein